MEKTYCVKFIRRDGANPPVEMYYFNDHEDARAQFDFFRNDLDPDYPMMYDRIQLINIYGSLSTVSEEIRFH